MHQDCWRHARDWMGVVMPTREYRLHKIATRQKVKYVFDELFSDDSKTSKTLMDVLGDYRDCLREADRAFSREPWPLDAGFELANLEILFREIDRLNEENKQLKARK